MAIQRLTAAYRSRSRPSSTLGAKASTMCPYYLDGDLDEDVRRLTQVIPVSLATVQFSRSVKRLSAGRRPGARWPSERRRHAGLSKLNSMRRARPRQWHGRLGCQVRSTCLVTECAQSFGREELQGAPGRPPPAFGALA
jgi:hypothetical protein